MLLVVFSDLTIGQMMAVFGYLWFMMSPVQEVLNIQFAWYGAKAALSRINRLWLLRAEPEYPHEVNPFEGRKTVSVSVHDLCFAYGHGPLVLDHLSLEIAAGDKVALVGASGGGKSTLVQVLLGLYPPLSGELRFHGVPVTRIGLDVVREHVAVVLQHPAMLNDTVRINLTLGRELDDDSLWTALAVAQIDEYIAAMPRDLDALIGRQGIRLSGGQRQRLAMARMMLSDPKMVILQHPAMLNDTVRINLTLGRELDDDSLWTALAVAQIDEYIAAMPRDLDALIGRQGIRLSGGQRQRLAMARMMLSDPKMVILDEATSALDTETEARLHDALGEFLTGRTTLIIAHRLSAVKQANRVYVFDAGRIIETGAHHTLMAAGGLYAKLYGNYQTA